MKVKNVLEVGFKTLTTAGIVLLIYFQVRSSDSIVYVDAIKLVNGYTGMKEARNDYEAKAGIWRTNLDSLKTELDAVIKDYQSKQATLNVKERQLAEEVLQAKQQQVVNYQQAVADKIQKEDQELTAKVLSRVNDYIKKYGQEKGYDIIMAATQYGNIVYSEKGRDITEEVLEGLNKEYSK
jgi:outer membrane protein